MKIAALVSTARAAAEARGASVPQAPVRHRSTVAGRSCTCSTATKAFVFLEAGPQRGPGAGWRRGHRVQQVQNGAASTGKRRRRSTAPSSAMRRASAWGATRTEVVELCRAQEPPQAVVLVQGEGGGDQALDLFQAAPGDLQGLLPLCAVVPDPSDDLERGDDPRRRVSDLTGDRRREPADRHRHGGHGPACGQSLDNQHSTMRRGAAPRLIPAARRPRPSRPV